MSIIEYSTGLPQNHAKKFDALTYKTAYATEEWDSDFTDDNCIVVYRQAKTPMMDTGIISKGELAGFYALKLYWTTNNLGNLDIEILIYRDGILEDTLTYFYGGDFLNTGSLYTVLFYPTSEYQIIVQTGQHAGASTVKLDYLQLESIPRNTVLGALDYVDVVGTPLMMVEDCGTITNTYSNTAASTGSVTFNVTFAATPKVYTQSLHQDHVATPINKTVTGCSVYSRHMDGAGSLYTGTVNIDWVAVGPVEVPFKSVTYQLI
jgi:hypothetical protein